MLRGQGEDPCFRSRFFGFFSRFLTRPYGFSWRYNAVSPCKAAVSLYAVAVMEVITAGPHRAIFLVVPALLCALALPAAAADVVVDHCGQLVEAGDTGWLLADLDCSAVSTEGVVLSDRASLHLDGFSIIGNPETSTPRQGVRCLYGSSCSVLGPGEIRGFSAAGVAGTRVRVRDLRIVGNGRAGVAAYRRVVARSVEIEENALTGSHAGLHAGRRVRVRDSVLGEHPAGATLTGN